VRRLSALVVVIVIASIAGMAVASTRDVVYRRDLSRQDLRRVNHERVGRSADWLKASTRLREIARRHVRRMARKGTIFHTNLGAAMNRHHICWTAWGQNVAKASSLKGIHHAYMNSPPHRAAILDPRYKRLGDGVARKGHYLYNVEDFVRLC
jgi:uncharacterized protein YkwD